MRYENKKLLIKKIFGMVILISIYLQYCFSVTEIFALDLEDEVSDEIEVTVMPSNDETGETDTENIQNAVNTATENDEKLIVNLTTGIYHINEGIRVDKNNIKIEGEDGTVFILGDNGNSSKADSAFFISGAKQERENITISNIDIEGKEDSIERWHGINIVRTKEQYEINNISILNCTINNINGRGVNISGFKKETDEALEKYADSARGEAIRDLARVNRLNTAEQKSKYDEFIENGILTGYEDICSREWYTRYTINNVRIEGCTINNTAGGIIQNTTYGTKIIGNTISNSYDANRETKGIENITIDFADNCTCIGNNLSGTFGGCANIGTGESDNCIIMGNTIDNSGYNRSDQKFNVGISHQSISGISYNYIIADNYITNANCGIWLKDNRYGISQTYAGSRAGEKFYVVNNTVEDFQECGIRVVGVTGDSYVSGNVCESEFSENDFEITDDKVEFTAEKDEIPPEIDIRGTTSDENYVFGEWTNQDVKITVDAEDTSGILEYSFDGGNTWQYSNYANSNEYNVSDSRTISVAVQDSARNQTTSNVQINIDKVTPTINSQELTFKNDKVYLEYSATDDDSGIDGWKLSTKADGTDGSFQDIDGNEEEVIGTITGEILIEEIGNYYLVLKDRAGNMAVSKEMIEVKNIEVIIDDIYDVVEQDGNKYIDNIKPSTSIEELLSKIETNGNIEIYKGIQKIEDTNTKLATGMKIIAYLGNQSIEYTIVVTGDLNGDGEIGDIDLLKLARYKSGLDTTLQGEYLQAANIYRDDNIGDDIDFLRMVRVIVGLDTL